MTSRFALKKNNNLKKATQPFVSAIEHDERHKQMMDDMAARLEASLPKKKHFFLTNAPCRGTISLYKSTLRSGPEFHAEWLRDEPCDATATEPGSYIPADWCQLSPGNREHGIRMRAFNCIR